MYYMIVNTADIPGLSGTTRVSVDSTQAVLDDVQFASLGVDDIECTMLSQKKAMALMETAEWKVTATEGE
jgi:hypothetical protein